MSDAGATGIRDDSKAYYLQNAFLHLEPINGVNFTKREVDVIACILSGKSVKKIALFLSISPKTVENHVHNIMLKLGCQSQENIIEFIEKSNKFLLIREHYLNLLIKSSLVLELKAISKLVAIDNYACLLIVGGNQQGHTTFITHFINDLKLVGFKVSIEYNEKNDFDFNQDRELQYTHMICILTNSIIYRLHTDNTEEHKKNIKTFNLTKVDKNLCAPAFFVVESQNSKTFLKESFSVECLSLDDQQNYYFFVFEVLKKLLPNLNVDRNILDFKKKYKTFFEETSLKKPSKKNNNLFKVIVHTLISIIKKSKPLKNITICTFILILLVLNFYKGSKNNQKKIINVPTLITEQEKYNQHSTFTQNRINSDAGLLLNLPARNSKFVGREKELKTINEFLNKYKFGVITQTISGLGGVGKTQLATSYAYSSVEEKLYDTILWIRAETSDSLNNSYIEFSKCLKIDIKGFKPTDIQHLLHEELKNFNAKNILFVLDNAVPSKHIEDYLNNLSKDFSTPSKLHVLITSRSQKWHKDELLLDTFTEQEAYAFIKKHHPNEKDDSIYNLAKTLHYFPLAINQAIIYIQAHTNIDTYIELLKPNNNYRKTLDNYTNALWSTWNLGFSNLSTNAKSILIISSYLDADEINLNYFESLTLEKRDSAIAELKNYSFITINNDKNSFKIHRLLQQIVREHEGSPTYLMKAIKILDFSFAIYQHVNRDLCDALMPHVISLAHHAIETPGLFYEGLALYMRAAMYSTYVQEDIKLSGERWSEILLLSKKHLSTKKGFSYLLANINTHIEFNNHLLGNLITAEETLKQAKDTYEKPLMPISTQIETLLKNLRWANQISVKDGILSDYAFTLNAIAGMEFDLNKISSSEENYKKALQIINQCKEQNKINVYKLAYLNNILRLYTYIRDLEKANLAASNLSQIQNKDTSGLSQSYAYEQMGDLQLLQGNYESAKKLFEQALNIKTKIYAKTNYRIGKNLSRLGLILTLMNQPKTALKYLSEAGETYEKYFSKSNVNYLYLYFLMHYACEANQDYKNSTQYLKQLHDMMLLSNNPNAHILVSKRLPIIDELNRLKASTKDMAYLQQSLELLNNIFGKDNLYASKYHYLLGTLFQDSLQAENAYYHFNTALNIILNHNIANQSLKTQNDSNISLIKEKIESLKRSKS